MNYTHHAVVRNRKLLGLMFSEAKHPFTNDLIQMIIEELGSEYEIVVLFSNEDTDREEQNVACLERLGVDALIFAAVSNYNYPEIEKMIEDGKPVIQIFMCTHQGADTILFDDELGTYRAVKYLLQNGHSRYSDALQIPGRFSAKRRRLQTGLCKRQGWKSIPVSDMIFPIMTVSGE